MCIELWRGTGVGWQDLRKLGLVNSQNNSGDDKSQGNNAKDKTTLDHGDLTFRLK